MELFFGGINLGLVGAIIFVTYMLRSFIYIPDKYAIFLPIAFGMGINMIGGVVIGNVFANFNEGLINGMAAAWFFKAGKSINPFSKEKKNGKNGGESM